MNGRFGAARHDDIGAPIADHLCAVRNGLRTGSACAHGAVYAGERAKIEANEGRGAIGHQHGHGVRGNARRTAL